MSFPTDLVISRDANETEMLSFLNSTNAIPEWLSNVSLWLLDHGVDLGEAAAQKNAALADDVNTLFIFVSALLVLSMQMGFALVEAGSVMANLRSILMKNIFDVCICTCCWLVVGFGVANGTYGNSVIGIGIPFEIPDGGADQISWFFGLSFVATSSTIVSGSMAERTKYMCYVVYTIFMASFIYPMVSRWVWNADGFMYSGGGVLPLLDFAGCGVVHMTGGISGLIGAWMVGPRPGIYDANEPIIYTKKEEIVRERLKATQLLFCVIGTMILWIGWYGFNCGSAFAIVGDNTGLVASVAINTTVAAVTGAVTATVASYIHLRVFLLDKVLMGILAGLVSITAGCNVVSPSASVAIGFVGFFFYYGAEMFLYKMKIDDPVAAFPVHGCCGIWGLICTGLFQQKSKSLIESYGLQLGFQILDTVIIVFFSLACSLLVFSALKLALGGSIRLLNVESEFKILEAENPRVGPLGDVTLVFTDIQGSTSLWESDAEAMAESLVMHDACVRRLIKANKGFEVKTEGDAFMVAFGSPLDALNFCIQCQKDLLAIVWPKEIYTMKCARVEESDEGDIIFKGVRIRMGFHSGQPAGKENPVTLRTDYFGRDVNYAARVSSAGAGGQILISTDSFRAMLPFYSDDHHILESAAPFGMKPGVSYPFDKLGCCVEYLGKYHLKGINLDPAGECIYAIIPFELEGRTFPPLSISNDVKAGPPTSAGKRNALTPKEGQSPRAKYGLEEFSSHMEQPVPLMDPDSPLMDPDSPLMDPDSPLMDPESPPASP